jgi:hypothetical protein
VKFLKLLLAILLLPATVGLTLTAWHVARTVAFGRDATGPVALAFWGGYGVWLLAFLLLPRPMRTYVLGHELTHAIWALMMGARVSGLRVSKTGGQVRTSKTNWFITLAPYFFPFYAMLFIALFFIAHAIWRLDQWMWALFFLVGLGWSFHVTFTLMMLFTVRQPDVQSQGVVFSAVVIFSMNLLVIVLTAAALARDVHMLDLLRSLGQNLLTAYGWTLDKLVALWHDIAGFINRARQQP